MKKTIVIAGIFLLASFSQIQLASAQSAEITQLALDLEKLAQLKKILSNMKKGYDIISKGYGTIKNLSEGNFNLHKRFLDGLLVVNPRLRHYKKAADIVLYQKEILSEYRQAFQQFRAGGAFTPDEIAYLGNVYASLFNRSLQDLNELATVLTDSKLRMSDGERLTEIDRIYADMQDKLAFLRSFNRRTGILEQERKTARQNAAGLQQVYKLNH